VPKRFWLWGTLCVLTALGWSIYRKPTASESIAARSATSANAPAQVRAIQPAPSPLPSRLERSVLESASRDPFAVGPTVSTQAVVAQPVVPVVIAPPPAPSPPSLNLRFAGRMTGPDGLALVFVLLGETGLSVTAGQTLPNGYRVETVTSRAIELSYPPLNTTTRLDLPDSPTHEIR